MEAYHYEGEKYLPHTIESVDYESVDSFNKQFDQVSDNKIVAEKLWNDLKRNYPKGTDKKMDFDLIFVGATQCRTNSSFRYIEQVDYGQIP